jgi:WD40 repeat protein
MQTNDNHLPCVLLVASSPIDEVKLQIEKEVLLIMQALSNSNFKVKSQLSTQSKDIGKALLKHKPTIVHFSGHGSKEGGIIFENNRSESNTVDTSALEILFRMFASHVNCVVLNACHSKDQAEAIVKHVDYVIGMDGAISDDAATVFSSAFYEAIGENKPIEFAYEFASNTVHMGNSEKPYHRMPVLYKRIVLPEEGSTNVNGSINFETISYGSEGYVNDGSSLNSTSSSTQPVRQSKDELTVSINGTPAIKRLKVSDARQTCCEWGNNQIFSSGFDCRLHSFNFVKNSATTYPFTSQQTVRSIIVFCKSILIGDDSGRVFSIEDNNVVEILDAKKPVFCISKAENDNTILLAEGGGRVSRWLILKESGSIVGARFQDEVHSHEGKAFYVEYDPFENRYVSVGQDGKVRYTKLATFEAGAIQLFEHTIFSLAVSNKVALIAVGDSQGNIEVSNDYFKSSKPLKGHTDAVRSLSFSRMGHWLASGSKDNTVKLWNLNVNRGFLILDSRDYIYEVKFSDTGQKLLIADGGGHMTCFDFIEPIDNYTYVELQSFVEPLVTK